MNLQPLLKLKSRFPVIAFALLSLMLGFTLGSCLHGCDKSVGPAAAGAPLVSAERSSVPPKVARACPSTATEHSAIPLPDGSVLTAAPSSIVKLRIEQQGDVQLGAASELESGQAKGPGIKSSADKIDEHFNASAPEINFGDGFFGRAGKTSYEAKLWSSSGANAVLCVGVLLVASGLMVWLWLKMPTLGLALVASGGVVIGVAVLYERYPWMLALGALAVVGFLAITVYTAYRNKQATSAVQSVVVGVQNGHTLGPADLGIPIDPAQYAMAQQIIDATVKAIKGEIAAQSEKNGGVVATFVSKLLNK